MALEDGGGELLRLATAGSVDDGKSTLIGRLLYDSKSIFEDQLEAVTAASRRRHGHNGAVDLSLLTDGLRAEREQGITIDVAHRYFATPKRTFIIADTPGHPLYTRNMVTGASTADLAIILIDARHGVIEQSRRHTFITTLLRVPHLVVAVNKMDLVDWSERAFSWIVEEFTNFAAKLEVADVTYIPISALHGDNVVERSENMRWYEGTPLLYHLEHVHIASDRNLIDPRLPVQWVVRPSEGEHRDYRGFAGKLAGGIWRAGDEVLALPSGARSTVKSVDAFDGPIDEAFPPMSVTVTLEDDIDVSRGDMLCRPHNHPTLDRHIDAVVCWMSRTPARAGTRYVIKHTTRSTKCVLSEVLHRVDVETLHHDASVDSLELNEIGRVSLRSQLPLAFDPYGRNRSTGSFILIDETTNDTVGAGTILGSAEAPEGDLARAGAQSAMDIGVTRVERVDALGLAGATVWLTGPADTAKSRVADGLERKLLGMGRSAYRLKEGASVPAEAASLLADAGVLAVVSSSGAYELDRDTARQAHRSRDLDFIEVLVDPSLTQVEDQVVELMGLLAERGLIEGAA